jgi:hypothetical protein
MPTRVTEIAQGASLPPCPSTAHTGCSVHRHPERIYEDQLWRWALAHPGHRAHDPRCG